MYSEGKGVAQDYKQAVSWYRKSADQGFDFGQYNLGFMYSEGNGVTKDYKQAVSWYRKAADQGNVYAEEWLGYSYEFGQGVTQDNKQAFKWYQKAAKQGSRYSQNQLGTMYENGIGVSQNDKLALNWYRKASDQGDLNAKKNLKALELSSGIKASEAKKIATKDEMETIKNDNNVVSSNATLEYYSIELEFWRSVQNTDNLEEYLIYLKKYPKGHFTELAELRINSSSTPTNQLSTQNFEYGNYYALVIGNDNYKHLKPLENAVNDANDVTSLLRSKYQFKVDVLANATRDEIVSALSDLRNSVSAKDNILIYYAGHGYLDKEMDEGFWLPVDATDDNQVHWIANDTIMRSVRAMKAKHVMIVADSCFSGTLTRGIKIANTSSDYIKEIVEKKARTVLTSGGLEPVSDVGGGNNSVFAASFLRILKENPGVMNGSELFIEIRKQVMQNTKDQTPEYGDIRKAGHDGGDFLFVRQ
jgi:hypothetical protein